MESRNTYIDQSTEKVITKRDLNRMAWRSLFLQASFNYERMQAAGWLYSLSPGLRKIHKNKEDLSTSMKMHMEFFNTHPFLVTIIMGIVIAMEESKESVDSIRGLKVAMMGPLGGIGDAIFWLTLLPISAGIGSAMAIDGSVAGPLIFLIIFNIVHFVLRFGLMHYGYKTGVYAVSKLKEVTEAFSHGASIVGVTVVGGLIASYIRLSTTLEVPAGDALVKVQADVLDAVMPNLLPLVYTLLMYKLIKKGFSPVKLVGVTMLIGVVGHWIQIL
jgi:PTS system N-acetylgalactosamine-specific IID component